MCLPSVSSQTWVTCGEPSGMSVARSPWAASFRNDCRPGESSAFLATVFLLLFDGRHSIQTRLDGKIANSFTGGFDMPVIDADTHVDETEDTWEHILPGDEPFKPVTAYPSRPDPNRRPTRYWVIDGKRQMRFIRDDARTQTTTEMRELLDVSARLRAMDERGVDMQVIYPTMFLVEGTDKAEVDLATRRSYNRWLADRCDQSGGRLRWVCLPPLKN